MEVPSVRLVNFWHGLQTRLGVVTSRGVLDLAAAAAPSAFPRTIEELLADSETGLLRIRAAVETAMEAGEKAGQGGAHLFYSESELRFAPPVPRPDKIICIGHNYYDHIREQNARVPEAPMLFAKWPNALIPTGAPIILPGGTDQVDYEAELAVIIGKRAKGVKAENALDVVLGYSIMNDVSARDYQAADRQWSRAKSQDSFGPFGPYLVTKDEIPDVQQLKIRCEVSGEVLQDSNTSEMVFTVAKLIEFISEGITLEPGDVIATGTPDGVGRFRNPQRYLRPGDEVAITIEGLGTLRNPVIAER